MNNVKWLKVDEADIQAFLDSVASEEHVYKNENSPERVAKYIEMLNRGDEMWWFDTPAFSLHLGLRVYPNGVGKAWMCFPSGAVTGPNASNKLLKKMGDRFLELGCTEFYGRSLSHSKYTKTGPARQMLVSLKTDIHPAWENTSVNNNERLYTFRKKID